MNRIFACTLFFALTALTAPALADLKGQASVIDGDTLEIRGQRIRLFGIDAPESGQTCERAGKAWRCGQRAAFALADKIGRRHIDCKKRDRDRYRRIVAICYLNGEDLNGWMVRQGWAVDYRQYSAGQYAGVEAEARQAKVGIWAGKFIKPWEWRQGQRPVSNAAKPKRAAPPATQSTECRIKGNISSRGARIYHVPGGQYYNRTRIDEAKGEQWFCSEAEARAAGWRRSKR